MKESSPSLSLLLKQALAIISNEKASKKITLEDITNLSEFIKFGDEFLSNRIANLSSSVRQGNSSTHRSNISNTNRSNSVSTNNNVKPKQSPIMVSGDIIGSDFTTDLTVSLLDISADIEQQVEQSKAELNTNNNSEADEVSRLNEMFDVESEEEKVNSSEE